MNRTLKVILSLLAVLAFFLGVWLIGRLINPSLNLDQTALLRFVFVGIGLVIVYIVYLVTRESKMWEVGTRQVVYMAIGAALFAIFSYLFNGTVFVVPSVSQVACARRSPFPCSLVMRLAPWSDSLPARWVTCLAMPLPALDSPRSGLWVTDSSASLPAWRGSSRIRKPA